MYRVRDISIYLLRNRLKELGIVMAIIFIMFLSIGTGVELKILLAMFQGTSVLISIAFIFYFSLNSILKEYKGIIIKGVSRNVFIKALIIDSIQVALLTTIYSAVLRWLAIGFNVGLFSNSVFWMSFENTNIVEFSVIYFMIMFILCGITNIFSILVYKWTKGANYGYLYIFGGVLGIYNLSRLYGMNLDFLNLEISFYEYSILYPIGISIILSIGLYYMIDRMIKKLEV